MLNKLVKKIFGSRNDRLVKRMLKSVEQINVFEPAMQALSDEELRAKTAEFRKRLEDGETLEALQPEAFAVVREAARRTLGMRHYDVQIIGGIALHRGMGDRYAHHVSLVHGDQEQVLLNSEEGDEHAAWPPSPPLQQVTLEDHGEEGRVLLLVGMAGRSHWSVAESVAWQPGKRARLLIEVDSAE